MVKANIQRLFDRTISQAVVVHTKFKAESCVSQNEIPILEYLNFFPIKTYNAKTDQFNVRSHSH